MLDIQFGAKNKQNYLPDEEFEFCFMDNAK